MDKGANLDDTEATKLTTQSVTRTFDGSHNRDQSVDNLTGSTMRMNFPDDTSPKTHLPLQKDDRISEVPETSEFTTSKRTAPFLQTTHSSVVRTSDFGSSEQQEPPYVETQPSKMSHYQTADARTAQEEEKVEPAISAQFPS